MSLTVFMAICILGCDFMLYVLFQWLYGEKHRKHVRRLSSKNTPTRMRVHEGRPYLVKLEESEIRSEEKTRMGFAGNEKLHVTAA